MVEFTKPDGTGYAIERICSIHKRPHLWRIDLPGNVWTSVGSFRSDDGAQAFAVFMAELGDARLVRESTPGHVESTEST